MADFTNSSRRCVDPHGRQLDSKFLKIERFYTDGSQVVFVFSSAKNYIPPPCYSEDREYKPFHFVDKVGYRWAIGGGEVSQLRGGEIFLVHFPLLLQGCRSNVI